MKKYLIGFLFLVFLLSFSEAKNYASGTNPEGECTDICQGVSYDPKSNTCNDKCCESNNLLTDSEGNDVCCKEGEKLNPNGKCAESCDGKFYGRGGFTAGANKCCPSPGIVYDKDSVTDNYAKCCQGIVYGKDIAPEQVGSLGPTQDDGLSCCVDGNAVVKDSEGKYSCKSCSSLKSQVQSLGIGEGGDIKDIYIQYCSTDPATCPANQLYTDEAGASKCCEGLLENNKCYVNTEGTAGIEMDQDCLMNGQCKFNIYDTLGIRQSLPEETRSSPGIFIQDIILSATFFVGTVITIVLIISGLLFVFSGINQDLHSKAKKGITGSLIGLLFVSGSYAFVRLIQFLVTGGGG